MSTTLRAARLAAISAAAAIAASSFAADADKTAAEPETPSQDSIMKIDDLLSQSGAFFLASADGDQPKLRPLGAHHVIDGLLWFGVGEFKAVYRELVANPKCEIVALQPDGINWLRYTGRAVFADGDHREALEEAFLAAAPGLRDIYDKTPGKRMMCFRLAEARAELIKLMPPGEIIADEKSEEPWDKVFPQSDKVSHSKVSFRNRFGILLVGDLYEPREIPEGAKLPAIAVCGPFGAVKEQCSGLYAQTMAERGFAAVAFDPSFTGESGGSPRNVASPDINTDDFSAAVDFLVARPEVDSSRISIIGICGWGGLALNAAAIDTRIKATVASTMYDMTRIIANGYFDEADNAGARRALRESINAQRTAEALSGSTPARAGGVIDPVPEDAPQFVKDYHAYYKTSRGYHPRSPNSTDGWNVTSTLSFLNSRLLAYAGEIESAVLVVHGEKAHSRYFGEDAFKMLNGDNKELFIIPGATHCDLYDGGDGDFIPWDKIESFIRAAIE